MHLKNNLEFKELNFSQILFETFLCNLTFFSEIVYEYWAWRGVKNGYNFKGQSSSYIVENKIQNKFDEIARFYEKK